MHNHLSMYHQVCCCCYHSAPCLVNPPCQAEVINLSRVVRRSIYSFSRFLWARHWHCARLCVVPFSWSPGHPRDFLSMQPIWAVRKRINCCHLCCKLGPKQHCVQVCSAGDLQVFIGTSTKKCRCNSDALDASKPDALNQAHVRRNDGCGRRSASRGV